MYPLTAAQTQSALYVIAEAAAVERLLCSVLGPTMRKGVEELEKLEVVLVGGFANLHIVLGGERTLLIYS